MKKILCLFLSLLMLLPAVVSQADDSGIISEATVFVTLPKAGTKADTTPEVSVPSGSPYSVVTNLWAAADKKGGLPYSTVFESGKKYACLIVLYRANGYSFASPCIINVLDQNTHKPLAVDVVNADNAYQFFFAEFTIPPAISEPDPTPIAKPDPVPEGSTEKITFSKLKSVKVTAVSAKKLKVSWKKLSSKDRKKIKKIEIQFSTDKKFRKNVKSKFVSSGKTSYTISGLKKNTKYYVRIRAYTKSGKVINLSKWVTKNQKTRKK